MRIIFNKRTVNAGLALFNQHHGGGLRLQRFENVLAIGGIADVIAGAQLLRLVCRPQARAPAADNHMLDGAGRMRPGKLGFSGLHPQPVKVALGALLFGEKLTANRLGWLLLAFAGMVLIVTGRQNGGGDDYLLGVALALGAALMYAIAAAIVKQLAALPPQLIVLIQLTVGALVMAPFAGLATPPAAPIDWLLLATLGLVHTGLMSTLLYGAIQKIPTSLVGALSFIYPAVAIVVDWAAFGHRLSLLQLLGTLAILGAAAGMNFGWRLSPVARRADKTG